jgi:uncharacterized protein YceH (UPF0502 family)
MARMAGEETEPTAGARLELDAEERRVLGVLIEKGLSTPQQYPLSLNALVAGCNQKNNRDPITDYDEDRIVHTLARLRTNGLISEVMPSSGRVSRFRQELGAKYQFRGVELAVIGELLLRGAQSEGDLRQRASRMRDIPSLDELHQVLAKLRDHVPPFVARLTPEGVSRGVRWTHCCWPAGEVEELRALERADAPEPRAAAAVPGRAGGSGDLAEKVAALEQRIERLERWIEDTKEIPT